LHAAKIATKKLVVAALVFFYYIALKSITAALKKRCIHLLFLLLYLFPLATTAQTLRQPISAVYLGLGAYSTRHQDVFSFANNQASLAQIKNTSMGVYGERRFMLEATTMYTASVAVPSNLGNFGLNIKYSGFKNFNENQIGLAYGRKLGSKVDIGVQFNYYGYRVPSYNNASTVNFEVGAIVHLTDKLNAGLHVYNPVGGKFLKSDEQLTAAYTFGLGYDASDRFFVSAEIVKEEEFPVNLNAGMQYNFDKRFFARAGIASANSNGYLGFGVSFGNFRVDVSGSYHPQLGVSPGLLFIMDIGKKEVDKAILPE
jgi:hypothetical protein